LTVEIARSITKEIASLVEDVIWWTALPDVVHVVGTSTGTVICGD